MNQPISRRRLTRVAVFAMTILMAIQFFDSVPEHVMVTTQETITTKKNASKCFPIRGSSGGKWVQDTSYAASLPYYQADASFFSPTTSSTPYYPPSTYRWQDRKIDIDHNKNNGNSEISSTSCQTQVCTRHGFCQELERLGVTRVFMVGDSLTGLQTTSLRYLLNETDPLSRKPRTTIACSQQFSFRLQFVRNDKLRTSTKSGQCVGGICNSWTDKYLSNWNNNNNNNNSTATTTTNAQRTLFIANFGPHIHEKITFQLRMQDFFNWMVQHLSDSTDIIVFRTSVPGHYQCTRDAHPLANDTQFFLGNDHYDWNKMQSYNEFAIELLESANHPNWHILDVFPMTILRPDGHLDPPRDCLHYHLPGPPDWWNHLLYSQLQDLE
jgi:hypothetical protein